MANPIHELRHFLSGLCRDLRLRRDHRNVLEVEALQDIAGDIAKEDDARKQTAFKARVLDDEGLALLDKITAPSSPGGALIVPAEVPDLRRAQRCIRRSAALDHAMSEGLSAQLSEARG